MGDGCDAVEGGQSCTLSDIVFEDGAAFVRGEYRKHDVMTPVLTALDMGSFAVEVEFQLKQQEERPKWVLIAGFGHRWFGIGIKAEQVMVSLNNQENMKVFAGTSVSLEAWHTLAASLDLKRHVVQVWFDGA